MLDFLINTNPVVAMAKQVKAKQDADKLKNLLEIEKKQGNGITLAMFDVFFSPEEQAQRKANRKAYQENKGKNVKLLGVKMGTLTKRDEKLVNEKKDVVSKKKAEHEQKKIDMAKQSATAVPLTPATATSDNTALYVGVGVAGVVVVGGLLWFLAR